MNILGLILLFSICFACWLIYKAYFSGQVCTYCKQKISGFANYHPECQYKYATAVQEIREIIANGIVHSDNLDSLQQKIKNIATERSISEKKVNEALIDGWERALDHFLEDNVLTVEEEKSLVIFQEKFGLNQYELDSNGAYTKSVQAAILRDITEGKPTDRIKFNNVPFNLQKNENLIYLFNDVPYYEEKVKRSYVGGYAGVSIKIAKGIYYKTGAFKGHPVETSQMVNIDNGCVGVTTKHIYFAGGRKSFRAPFTKIINLTPYTDGIGIHLDNKTAKPQILKTGNGWFIYNLVQNLSQM